MKTFLRILGFLAILIIAFSIFIATKPSNYEVKRTKLIKAPLSLVYATVNEYKTWKDWGPWRENDDILTSNYSDITSGINSGYSWDSSLEGHGSIKTIDLKEYEFLNQKIITDRYGESDATWLFENTEDGTKVTWVKKGKLDFISKAFYLLIGDSEKIFEQILEYGLTNLDSYVKKAMNKHSFTNAGIVEYGGGYYIHLTTECAFDEMGANLDKMLPEVLIYAMQNSYPRAGDIFTLYHKYDEENKRVEFSSCIPVKERVSPEGDIALAFMETGRYHKTTFQGDYKYSQKAWEKAFEFAKADGLTIPENGKPFEVYRKGHTDSLNPADWITEIYLPIE